MTEKEATYNRVSSSAVRAATGRGWEEWLPLLDEAGAAELDHKGIVALVQRLDPDVDGWWQQSVAVGYEKARGKRVLGQVAGGGFQLGVSRTTDLPVEAAWALLTERTDLWLGGDVVLEQGATYEVAPGPGTLGAAGQVRVVRPLDRVRLTWQPQGWSAPATLQLTVSSTKSGRTTIGVHLEKLPDAPAREQMRGHWAAVLDRLLTTG